jgi:G-patch domain
MTKKTSHATAGSSSSNNNDDRNETGVAFLQLAGRKLKNRLGSTMNESASAGPGGGSNIPAFAKKQLEKLGWNEGEGLGKRRQGMASHIKVTKRAEGLGLGESTLDPAIAQSLNADDWWKNSVGDTLARLKGTTKNKKKKDKKDSAKETKVHYTDDELFAATGGARFGMRAQRRQDAKWKRSESNISEQEENEAREKVEWDGLKAPKVLLSSDDKKSSKKRKSNKEVVLDELLPDEKADQKRQKKEKKQRQNEENLKDHSTTIPEKKKPKKSKVSKEQ